MLLTRLPLTIAGSLDLHVLGLPPAFVLSQDQTLKFNVSFHPNLRRGEELDPVTRLLSPTCVERSN